MRDGTEKRLARRRGDIAHPVLVVLVVGLTPRLVGPHTPHLARLAADGGMRVLSPILPAVTCSVQATLLTGLMPSGHGIVANGWYARETSEIRFWLQSNRLVGGEKVWQAARRIDPRMTTAQMFWWYNMYADVEYSATPRPIYRADGRKLPDHYASPPGLHDELEGRLGSFPLFRFWGPATDITSTDWIAEATLYVLEKYAPTLVLCYLPHLDYGLQRWGPDPQDPRVCADLAAVDAACGRLIAAAEHSGRSVVVVSEYAIVPVRDAVHVNRALREAGLLVVRDEQGSDVLDAGASRAFAVADHQVAHIYVDQRADVPAVRRLVAELDGVETVLDSAGKAAAGLDHPRAGELVAIAARDRWFSYYYWLDDARAPDFARTVDIHRKPGYDPMELFVDPALRWPKARIARRLAARAAGFRALLDVVPIGPTTLVRGSHGRVDGDPACCPAVLTSRPDLLDGSNIQATDFKDLLLDHLFVPVPRA